MNSYVLLTSKTWHNNLFKNLSLLKGTKWTRIKSSSDFNYENIVKINPKIIFCPHWSEIIPKKIYSDFNCVVFHMTDLPYGRGGSPLQNLIVRGHKKTKISALKVTKGIDTGPIYLKCSLDLSGSASEIMKRTTKKVEKMIHDIISRKIIPKSQAGKIVLFKRRNPSQSNIKNIKGIKSIYDYIRMLDCEGYPNAFIDNKDYRFTFTNAKLENNIIEANVRIFKK